MNGLSVTEGPVLNGKPTQIQLLSTLHFKKYPYLEEFLSWANPTFMNKHSHIIPPGQADGAQAKRFENVDKMLEELAVPEGFTYLVTSKALERQRNGSGEWESEAPKWEGKAPEIFATVSGRPFKGTRSSEPYAGDRDERLYAEGQARGVQQWEIKTVIVGEKLQGQGLGKLIMDLAEAEFVRRYQVMKLQHARGGKVDEDSWKGVQAMLTTVTTVNASFYEKCGYRKWEVTTIPEGMFHGNKEFEVSWMVKDLPC